MCAKLTSRRSSKPEGVQQSNGGPWSLQVLLLHAVREITIPIRGGRRLAAFDILFGRLQHRGPTPVSCAGPSFKSCLAPTSFWIPPIELTVSRPVPSFSHLASSRTSVVSILQVLWINCLAHLPLGAIYYCSVTHSRPAWIYTSRITDTRRACHCIRIQLSAKLSIRSDRILNNEVLPFRFVERCYCHFVLPAAFSLANSIPSCQESGFQFGEYKHLGFQTMDRGLPG